MEEDFYNMQKRYAIGKVTEDIYQEFAAELKHAKEDVLKKLQELENRSSNPEKLIQHTCYMAANLAPVWDSWNYYDKQNFQNIIFPLGYYMIWKVEFIELFG